MYKAPDIQQMVIFSQTQGLFFPQGSSSTFAFQPNCCHRGWQIYLLACSLDMRKLKHVVLRYHHYSISYKMVHDHRGTHQKSLPCEGCASNLPPGQAHTWLQSVNNLRPYLKARSLDRKITNEGEKGKRMKTQKLQFHCRKHW